MIKLNNFSKSLVLLQYVFFLAYLFYNILTVGSSGGFLIGLIGYFFISNILIFIMFYVNGKVFFSLQLFMFLVFSLWLSIRIIVDLHNVNYLIQLTVATTGGIFVFYIAGAFLGMSFYKGLKFSDEGRRYLFILIFFLFFMIYILWDFSERMHPTLFYLSNINGLYQRSGNFLSISFIFVSFLTCASVVYYGNKIFKIILYTMVSILSIIISQLLGSNSATAIISGIYLITLVMMLVVSDETLFLHYANGKTSLLLSKALYSRIFIKSLYALTVFSIMISIFILFVGINNVRLFGFGSGVNESLSSRTDILISTGLDQLAYAPIFGNANVAYLVTGESGRTLHSFFPSVMSTLGAIGLLFLSLLLFVVFYYLLRDIKGGRFKNIVSYKYEMMALYSLFVLVYILLFANMSSGVSWIVIWFLLGFVSKPINFHRGF